MSGMDSCQFARPRGRAPPPFFSSHRLSSLLAPGPAPQRPSFYLIRRFSSRQFSRSPRPRTKHRFRLKRNNTGSNTMKFLPCKRAYALRDLRPRRSRCRFTRCRILWRKRANAWVTRTQSRSVTRAATARTLITVSSGRRFFTSRGI